MRYTSFEITNFRGIENVKLNLVSKPESNIHCLVGLNESGKTTVLEAINYFTYNSDGLNALELKGYSIDDPNSLIPIAKRSNFSSPIKIEIDLDLNESDELFIRKEVKSKHEFAMTRDINKIKITQVLEFENSKFKKNTNLWSLNIFGKKNGSKKEIYVVKRTEQELWLGVLEIIKLRIPEILYFPNFLFDFPERIILDENADVDKGKHKFYSDIFQDILDSLNNDVNVKTHIVDRAKSSESSDKVSLDQLLLDASRSVSKNVFSQWNNIFKSKYNDKKIVLKYGVDDKSRCYIEFKIEENGAIYNVTERSLGFRWFFVFFLLTYYRARRLSSGGAVLFLFDEPASNLHQSAQAQLLKTFAKISESSQIIYTTHSHHLINPAWLDATHIVRNEGLHSPEEIEDYDSSKTKVLLFPYRSFVTTHPDQRAYFQPILDILDYCPSDFEMVDSVVMTEGKGDFYWLKYFLEIESDKELNYKMLPGTGSGSLHSSIQLYLAWGKNFLVLLDDDAAGKKEKERYIELFGPAVEDKIKTYKDINSDFAGFEVEDLLQKSEVIEIQKLFYPEDSKFNKTHAMRSVQELLAKKTKFTLSESSQKNVSSVLGFCQNYFSSGT
jgi:predicted ATP-dependent endonuclease of OLD family